MSTYTQVICRGDPDKTLILSNYKFLDSGTIINKIDIDTTHISSSVVTISPTSPITNAPDFPFTITNTGIGEGYIVVTIKGTQPGSGGAGTVPFTATVTIYIIVYNCMTIPVCVKESINIVPYTDIIGTFADASNSNTYSATTIIPASSVAIDPTYSSSTELKVTGGSYVGYVNFNLSITNPNLTAAGITFVLPMKVQVIECVDGTANILDPVIVCKGATLDPINLEYYFLENPTVVSTVEVTAEDSTDGTVIATATVGSSPLFPITITAGSNPGLMYVLIKIFNVAKTLIAIDFLPVIVYDCTPIDICANTYPICQLATDIVGSTVLSLPSILTIEDPSKNLTVVPPTAQSDCIYISADASGAYFFTLNVAGKITGDSLESYLSNTGFDNPADLTFSTDILLNVNSVGCPAYYSTICNGRSNTIVLSDYSTVPPSAVVSPGVTIDTTMLPSFIATVTGSGPSAQNYPITITGQGLGFGILKITVNAMDTAGKHQTYITDVPVVVNNCTPIPVCLGKTVCVPFTDLWGGFAASGFDISTPINGQPEITVIIDTVNSCVNITGNSTGAYSFYINFTNTDPTITNISTITLYFNVQVNDCSGLIPKSLVEFFLSLNQPTSRRC